MNIFKDLFVNKNHVLKFKIRFKTLVSLNNRSKRAIQDDFLGVI
jgi:hypothetical protein